MKSPFTVDDLLARAEIQDLLVTYCNRLDEYDIAGACSIFVDDVVTDYGPATGGELSSRAALIERLERSQAQYVRTHHQVGQQEITIDGAAARAMTYATAWHERADGSNASVYVRYIDELLRSESQWWVTRRQALMAGVVGLTPEGFTWVPRRLPPTSNGSAR